MVVEKTTLVILAAGMASRYGGNKQIEGFGPNGETIMEYSIFDAIRAGFKKVIFIIQERNFQIFKDNIEPKIHHFIEIDYVFQSTDKFSGELQIPAERIKPFGTAHALLCCLNTIDGPFAVINADDFYGKEAFEKAAAFLYSSINDDLYGCLGYKLGNTLSENGFVTRGEILTDEQHHIEGIIERKKIFKEYGKAITEQDGVKEELALDANVSMNFFLFTPTFVHWLEKEYAQFLNKNLSNLSAEFLIPEMVDVYIKNHKTQLKLLATNAKWFGVTYKADAPLVKAKINELVVAEEYPLHLWKRQGNAAYSIG